MAFIYNEKEIKTKQDAIDTLEEIRAYQNLEGLSFDFGNGLIQNDLSYGTEYVYWKMDAQVLEDIIEDWEYDYKSQSNNSRQRPNKHYRKIIGIRKLKKLLKSSCYTVYYNEKENRYVRWYLSGRKGFAKWCSDRAVRNRNDFPLRGAGYKRCYDYWWQVF